MNASKPTGRVQPKQVQSRRGLAYIVVALVAVAVVVGVFVNQQRVEPQNEGYGTTTAPVSVADGVVRVGQPGAATTIDLYEDFQCPVCAQLERVYGQQLAQAMDEGRVAVRYHMLTFLNSRSASGNYSERAAGAALAVAGDGDGAAFAAFHTSLFTNQPEEGGSTDLSDADLAGLARDAGASAAAVQAVTDGTTTQAAATAAAAGEQQLAAALGTQSIGTPTVLRDGQQVNLNDSSWVTDLG